MKEPRPNERYTNFKGGRYEVIKIAKDCENLTKRGVYRQLYNSKKEPTAHYGQEALRILLVKSYLKKTRQSTKKHSEHHSLNICSQLGEEA